MHGVDVEGDPTRLGTSGFTICGIGGRGIGGKRVLTEIDGVPTAEHFDFGPFSIFQLDLDVDTLESVEIVRSAGSALYSSDATHKHSKANLSHGFQRLDLATPAGG